MKKFILACLILSSLGLTTFAQKPKSKPRTLPTGIVRLKGSDPDELFKNRAFQTRFKALLGRRYEDFMESFETKGPLVKRGSYLFTSGCLIHACTHLESALAIDLVKKTIHAAIFRQNEKTRYFNEDHRKTPSPIKSWADNLMTLNKK